MERAQINKIRDEKEFTTSTREMQKDHKRLLLHDNKIDNLEEMYKFWEMYNFPGQNQEEIENMSRPITNKTESVI